MATPYRAKQTRKVNRKIRARNAKFLLEYKTGKACKHCGGKWPPYVLDFDHIDPKTKVMGVSRMATQTLSLQRIKAEITKCRILCANCHRERTHKRRKQKPL